MFRKTALPNEVCDKRLAFVKHMVLLGWGAGRYHRNVVWLDFCNSIIPQTARRAKEQALARKAKRDGEVPVPHYVSGTSEKRGER